MKAPVINCTLKSSPAPHDPEAPVSVVAARQSKDGPGHVTSTISGSPADMDSYIGAGQASEYRLLGARPSQDSGRHVAGSR
ncbi:hypothetical protein [Streptomyces adustus]